MGNNAVETLMGALVLAIAAAFAVFAYNSSSVGAASDGYRLTAKFQSVDGLALGGDVRIGGIKVGTVTQQALEDSTYLAVVGLTLREGVRVPADSTAAVVSDGLLGGKYLSITPGAEEKMLENGGEIKFTQSAVNLESMIGKFMFSGGGVEGEEGEQAPPAEKAAPAEGEDLGL